MTTAEAQLQQHSKNSSFQLAMLLLPRRKRKALLTLYAVCRALDDAVDNAANAAEAQSNLTYWQKQLDAAMQQQATSEPLAEAFAAQCQQYNFDPADIHALCDAMQHDVENDGNAPSWQTLEQYCYGAASAVGLLSMSIFGCHQPEARPFAIALGHALQLTNILRDVRVDAEMGRVYLPCETLPTSLRMAELVANASLDVLQPACAAVAQRAYERFCEADNLATALPTRDIAPALAMRDVYALYWRKLQAEGWAAPKTGRISLNTAEKARLASRASGYKVGIFRPFA